MKSRLLFLTVALAVLVPLSVFADPVTGDLYFTGDVTATLTSLNFSCATGATCPSGTGSFTINGALSTGTFAGMGGDTGYILNISSTSAPVGSTVSLANFLTVPSAGASFALTELDPGTGGSCPPAAGATCTLPGTATTFENTKTGSGAEFSVNADAFLTSASGQTTAYTGSFAATFPVSVASELNTLATTGSITTNYVATFTPVSSTTTVPEPGTASLIALGVILLGAGAGVRRFSHC